MIRRTIAVITGFVLFVGMLSGCTPTESTTTAPIQETTSVTEQAPAEEVVPEEVPTEEAVTEEVPAEEVTSPAPAPEPQVEPPVVENSLVMVSELDVDTSKFTSPVGIFGFELMNAEPGAVDAPYMTVGLSLSDQDWKEFARQAGLDSTVDSDQVQLDSYTANSLYDLNTLASEIMDYQQSRGQLTVDIHEIETHWRLVVH